MAYGVVRPLRSSKRREPIDGLVTYGFWQLLLSAVLLLNSLLGPLVLGVVSYPITGSTENQLIGLELVTLFLVVPWAAVAGVAALRGHASAPVLGFAPAAYAAYMFVQYVLGPEYDRSSVTVLAQVGIFVLAAGLTVASWSLSQATPVPVLRAAQRTRNGWGLLALAAFVLLRYTGTIRGAFSGEPLGAELAEEPTFFWSIVLLDLGIVVPCTVAAGVALLRGASVGRRALYAVVGWFALVPPSVASMALVMWVRDDPHASLATVVLLGVASIAFGAFAWHTLRPVVTGSSTEEP